MLTLPLSALLVEIAMRIPFGTQLRDLQRFSGRAVHVISAGQISDHWKEKAMRAYAGHTCIAALKLAACLAAVLGAATIVVVGLEQLFQGFQSFVLSWAGIAACAVSATLYWTMRREMSRG